MPPPPPATSIGVPCKLLKEYENKKITVDTSTGEVFVGTLIEAEDNMNVSLSNVKTTFPSGHVSEMKSVYVKGSKIRYIGLPSDAAQSVNFLVRSEQRRGGGRGGFRGGRGGRGGGGGRPSYGDRDRSYGGDRDRRRY